MSKEPVRKNLSVIKSYITNSISKHENFMIKTLFLRIFLKILEKIMFSFLNRAPGSKPKILSVFLSFNKLDKIPYNL